MHDWKEIRERYGTLIFSAAYRILKRHDQALDCYQEVFLEAFEQCEQHSVHNWPAYLTWLAIRRALDRLRKERRVAARLDSEQDAQLLPATSLNPCEEVEFQELVDRVRVETARLPGRQGEAFWLRCIEQLSAADVAEQFGVDANSVNVLVHRARTRLRELLADANPAHVKR